MTTEYFLAEFTNGTDCMDLELRDFYANLVKAISLGNKEAATKIASQLKYAQLIMIDHKVNHS